jgi:hypothetical protein
MVGRIEDDPLRGNLAPPLLLQYLWDFLHYGAALIKLCSIQKYNVRNSVLKGVLSVAMGI